MKTFHHSICYIMRKHILDMVAKYFILYSYFRSSDSNDVTDKKKIIRKYKCPTCDKSYTESHNLKKHRQKEHGL